MDKVLKITLVGKTYAQDTLGQYIPTPTERNVMARQKSVTRQEFFQASQGGYKPEIKLSVHRHEYQGEDEVKIGTKTYSVYRTYEGLNNELELYLERKANK